jgi:anti-anti-sigma factor
LKTLSDFDRRPILVTVAGPNGAGKTAFCDIHLASSGLRRIDAEEVARDLQADPYEAARTVDALRRALIRQGESFVFQTVFSEAAAAKLGFLKEAEQAGYTIVLCFIGLENPELCEERVCIRVSQGGHDVPAEKLQARFPRTLANLKAVAKDLPHVLVYDNSDPSRPFRQVAVIQAGRCTERVKDMPAWAAATLFSKARLERPAADAGPARSPKGKLTLNVRRRPQGRAILRVEGSIDHVTFKQFESAFRWFDKQEIRYLVVDMALLTYISSSALSLLIKVKTEYAKHKGDVVLVRPQTPIINIMRVMGLMDLFRIASSAEEAFHPPAPGAGK